MLIGFGAADNSNVISGAGGVSSNECASTVYCATSYDCYGNECASCAGCSTGGRCPSSNDCVTTSECTTSGVCVTTSGCTTSANCPTGSGCTTTSACTTTTNCPTTSDCVTTSGCTTNANCPSSSDCATTSECTSSNDCVTTSECTTSSGCITTSGCTTNANCPSSSGCVTTSECTTSSDCVTTSGCTTNANCPSSSDCVTSANCITGTGCATGSDCTTGSDCPTGTSCITGIDCPTGSDCPVGGGCIINPQFPSSNGIITGDICPTDSNCPSDSSCPSGSDCPTALICPTFSECTTSSYCPTGSDCVTSMSCPTGFGCVAGPECEPSCPQDLTCPTCAVATQKSHAENLQRLMASSLRNIDSYCYTGNYETCATFLSHSQAIAHDSSSCEEEEGYLDLKDLACKLSSKSTRANGEGGSTEREVETYLIDDALYTCDNNEWTKLAVINSGRAIEERDQLKIMTDMIAGSKVELIDSEQVNGENCYKLKFVPDVQVSQRILASQALAVCSMSPVTLPDADMGLLAKDDSLLREGTMTWTAWISTEDYLLRQVESEMKFTLTPESLHLPQEVQDLRVEMASKKETRFSDFDKKKPLALPNEAKHARIVPA